jgi:hypothetical protein
MSAIICDRVEDINEILHTFHWFHELGLSPSLIVAEPIQDILRLTLKDKVKHAVEEIIMPSSMLQDGRITTIPLTLFNRKYIISYFQESIVIVPHPYHHLKLTPKQYILSTSTVTGFAQVKTFPISQQQEVSRELLELMSPTFITLHNDQTFIFRGGLTQSRQLSFKKHTSLPESVTGFSSIIRIMPCTNWTTSEHLIQEWSRFCKGTNILLTTEYPDYYLVINSTNQQIDPSKTIYFMMEPYGEKLFKDWLRQFPKFLFYGSHQYHLNNIEWHLSYSLPELQNKSMPSSNKIRGLCAIVSSRATDPGQIYRLELIKALDQLSLPFPFHIYGKCSELGFNNYKGELPRISKEKALEKYQYNLICENNPIDNYITEKLYDGILCESYTFYKGAPNVHMYFEQDSFGLLSGHIQKDIEFIINTIQRQTYEHSLPKIKEMKQRILNQWSLPIRLNSIIELSQALVLVRYNTEEEADKHHFKVESLLHSQSFHTTANGIFEKKDSLKTPWVMNVIQTALQHDRCVIVIDADAVHGLLFQHLSNLMHLKDADLFMLQASSFNDSTIFYFRLKGCEKISMNVINGLPALSGITKCIFTV